MDSHHPIVIVGAGLGGLSLARVLHVNGIEAVVLELDAHDCARKQGGMLDIHDDSGRIAIRTADLDKEFSELILAGGEARRVLDKEANVWISSEGPGGRPEVERGELRQLLLDSLPENTVRWGAKVVDTTIGPEGRPEVTLADGSTIFSDVLVGADGTWSRVRRLLTAATPLYSGVTSVEGYLYDADRRHPQAAWAMGAGSLFAISHQRSLMGHREADSRLQFYAWMCVDEAWATRTDFANSDSAKRAVLEQYVDWASSLRSIISEADSELIARALYYLPIGHRWPRTPGVTLIGDAAHVMSPTGDGANLAMIDGSNLASAIAEHPGELEVALSVYESVMFDRAEGVARESAGIMDVLLRDTTAPKQMVELFAGLEGQPVPAVPLQDQFDGDELRLAYGT